MAELTGTVKVKATGEKGRIYMIIETLPPIYRVEFSNGEFCDYRAAELEPTDPPPTTADPPHRGPGYAAIHSYDAPGPDPQSVAPGQTLEELRNEVELMEKALQHIGNGRNQNGDSLPIYALRGIANAALINVEKLRKAAALKSKE